MVVDELRSDLREAAPSRSGALSITHVSRHYGAVTALDDISLTVTPGEIVCLVGHSGCGKSTLLRMIAGVDRPDAGRIVLDGRTLVDDARFVEPERRSIGFMFQDYALFPHLTVMQNIAFGLKRLPGAVARQRCDDVLDRLGLRALAQRHPHMLSGGEQQRVALARALAPQPVMLLMDEPFSNLDRRLRQDVRDETMATLRTLGTTVVVVTHDPEEALSLGDRVVLMRDGRIEQVGTGRALYDHPASAYAAEFFCAFNRVPGRCRDGRVETAIGSFPCAGGHVEDGAVTVLVRLHGLALTEHDDGVAARVVAQDLLGEVEQWTVAVDGLAAPLRLRSTVRHNVAIGDRVRLALDPRQSFVFPAP